MNKFIVRFKRAGQWFTFCNWLTGMPVLFPNLSRAEMQAQSLRENFGRKHAQAVAV
jgi:hypothetical protein